MQKTQSKERFWLGKAAGWARRHPVAAVALFLLALLFLELPGVVLMRQVPLVSEMAAGSDLQNFNYPVRRVLSDSLHRGRVPLWTDQIHAGFPIHAEGQGGFLYPPNVLLGFLPLAASIDLSFLLVYLCAGLFTFLYAREIGQGRLGAAFAAMVFTFSGFLGAHIRHMNMIAAAQWLPLLLFFCERYARTRRARYFLAIAAVQALQHLAGHPQTTYYGILFCALYLPARVLVGERRSVGVWGFGSVGVPADASAPPHSHTPTLPHSHTPTHAALALAGSGAAVALGAGLAAAQLLPSLELMRISGGGATARTYERATYYELPPSHLAAMVAPFAFGDPGRDTYAYFRGPKEHRQATLFWENTGYVGLIPLALAGLALLALARRNRWVLLLGGAAAVSLLLALGKNTPLFYWVWRCVPGMSGFRVPSRFLLVTDLALAVLAGFGLAWVRARLAERRPRLVLPVVALLFALSAADLLHCGARCHALVDARAWLGRTAAGRDIAADPESGRVLSWRCIAPSMAAISANGGWRQHPEALLPLRNALLPNDNILQGAAQFEHYAGFDFGETASVLALVNRLLSSGARQDLTQALRLLGLYHVGRIITPETLNIADPKVIATYDLPRGSGPLRVYANPYSLPRAYLADGAKGVESPEEAFGAVARPGFEPRREVLVEGTPPAGFGVPEAGTVTTGDVRWLRQEPETQDLDVDASRNCWLVVNDCLYLGWVAEVDGKLVDLYRANGIVRAVPVPPGRHRVTFRFEPASWNLGLALSAISLAVLLLGALLALRRE